jgi:2-polyprenyl-3-methyl-5-hydroxy-6-metoxy-1,4-benzoquinol methylase
MRPNPFKVYEFFEVTRASRLKSHHSILDLGCGKGYWTLLLASQCQNAVGIDPSAGEIEYAKKFLRHGRMAQRVQFMSTLLEEANLPPKSFDRIFSFCVLEHITNLETVLAEAHSLLKPDGEIRATVDSLGTITNPDLIAKHQREHFVHQYFTPSSLRKILETTGFEVVQLYPIMTSTFARQEFEKRILGNYKYGLLKQLLVYRRLQQEDRRTAAGSGVMLLVRARRSN